MGVEITLRFLEIEMRNSLSKLEEGKAIYTFRKKLKNQEEFSELFNALHKLSGKTADFRYHYFGDILSSNRRIFSVRNLPEKFWEGRSESSVLIATRPSKTEGFFIPWSPYENRSRPEVLQIIFNNKLVFENSFLIEKYNLRK